MGAMPAGGTGGMVPRMPPAGRPQHARPAVPAVPAGGPTPAPAPAPEPEPIPAHLRPLPGKQPSTTPAPLAPLALATPRTTKLTRRQKDVTPTEEAAFATIEAEMGGRQKLVSTLSTAQLPVDVQRVLGAIADPDNDKVSLAKVCAQHDVSLVQLLKVFQAALQARSQLQAHVKIASALPAVAASVMDAAVEGQKSCPKCLGVGTMSTFTEKDGKEVETIGRCDRCHGKGIIQHTPDHDVQKTALKLGKLLETGGLKIAMNQQTFAVGGGTDAASYDKLIGALDNHLYGRGRDRLQSGPDGDLLDGETIEGPHE